MCPPPSFPLSDSNPSSHISRSCSVSISVSISISGYLLTHASRFGALNVFDFVSALDGKYFAYDISAGLQLKLTEFISLQAAYILREMAIAEMTETGIVQKKKKHKGNLFLCHSRQPQKATTHT